MKTEVVGLCGQQLEQTRNIHNFRMSTRLIVDPGQNNETPHRKNRTAEQRTICEETRLALVKLIDSHMAHRIAQGQ